MHEAMKRNNGNRPCRRYEKELAVLDDRIQLLETVREMIDIEIWRQGLNTAGRSRPGKPSAGNARRGTSRGKPPRRTIWRCLLEALRGRASDMEAAHSPKKSPTEKS
jgi:hypothetical protein